MNESRQKRMSLTEYLEFRESLGVEMLKKIYEEAVEELQKDSRKANTENK